MQIMRPVSSNTNKMKMLRQQSQKSRQLRRRQPNLQSRHRRKNIVNRNRMSSNFGTTPSQRRRNPLWAAQRWNGPMVHGIQRTNPLRPYPPRINSTSWTYFSRLLLRLPLLLGHTPLALYLLVIHQCQPPFPWSIPRLDHSLSQFNNFNQ